MRFGKVVDLAGYGIRDRVGISLPYEWKDRVKELPGRRWDPELRLWTVPLWARNDAEALVNEYLGVPATRAQPAKGLVDAAEAFLKAVPQGLRPKVVSALVKVAHPDVGGDHELMVAINLANERTANGTA